MLKSGWDEYGISYGKATSNVHISNVQLHSATGAGLAFGSEMSGGISNIITKELHIFNSHIGIQVKTTKGRGGYVKDILISDAELENVYMGLSITGYYGSHPDDEYDPSALPVVHGITFNDVVGANITIAGNFSGLVESPFTSICLSNVTFSIYSESSPPWWFCSNVTGFSEVVLPEPCPDLLDSSLSCFTQLNRSIYVSSI